MNIVVDHSNRSLACWAPLILADRVPIHAFRADSEAWAAETNYRLNVWDRGTLIAFCVLTIDATGYMLTGSLLTNTEEAIAAFSAIGNPAEKVVRLALVDVSDLGIINSTHGQSDAAMQFQGSTDAEPLSADALLYDSVALTAGAATGTVSFGETFARAPVVTLTVETPAGGDVITASPTTTTSGFAYTLSGLPGAGYRLNWTAAKLTA